MSDLKGQKIRVPGPAPLHIEPFRKLGASPVSMPLGEALPAMQNRTIDGSIASASVFTAFKYYDVAKGLTRLPKSFLVGAGLVNRNYMKSLGAELEGIVREALSFSGVERGRCVVHLHPADAARLGARPSLAVSSPVGPAAAPLLRRGAACGARHSRAAQVRPLPSVEV